MDYITTPHQAELNAEAVLKSWGYVDAKATTGGADGGIDVRSSRALAQVKWKGGVVGRPDMQRLKGAGSTEKDKALYFFAASGYSRQSIEYANKVGIGLFTYDPTGSVTPVNRSVFPQIVGVRRWGTERVKLIALTITALAGAIALMVLGTAK